jgi:hypothetical protein
MTMHAGSAKRMSRRAWRIGLIADSHGKNKGTFYDDVVVSIYLSLFGEKGYQLNLSPVGKDSKW